MERLAESGEQVNTETQRNRGAARLEGKWSPERIEGSGRAENRNTKTQRVSVPVRGWPAHRLAGRRQ